jgi:hypothetical protein
MMKLVIVMYRVTSTWTPAGDAGLRVQQGVQVVDFEESSKTM